MTEADLLTIREIEKSVSGNQKIPAGKIKRWTRSPSVEVLGAVVKNVVRQSRRVEPPLSMEEICSVVQEYYRECLIQNLQESQYAPNRSVAGLELVSWFRSLWMDPAVPREYLTRIKTMVRDLCMEGLVPQNEVVGAVLEHLFEIPQIADFFADWKSDPELAGAFDMAMKWAKDHQIPLPK